MVLFPRLVEPLRPVAVSPTGVENYYGYQHLLSKSGKNNNEAIILIQSRNKAPLIENFNRPTFAGSQYCSVINL